jgi:uncharacterized protein
VFTTANLALGMLAALILGLSKTALPGGGLLAAPMFASIVSGRLIAGIMIPVLLLADVFAVRWYSGESQPEVLRPLVAPVAAGFAGGALFYAIVGSGGRTLDVLLGVTVIVMVAIQAVRLVRRTAPSSASSVSPSTTVAVGVIGGFTTFVANAAGPVLNTYFTGLGMAKRPQIGTSSVFYFSVNLAKVPVYLVLGWLVAGGAFFTADTLRFDALLVPATLAGVFGGKWLLPRIPQRLFTIVVLVLATLAAVKLIVGV